MREPGKILCDICGAEIRNLNRAIQIAVPLTDELRKPIIESIERAMPKGGLMIVPIDHLVPRKWTLEACGCVLGLLPQLPELVAADVRRHLEKRHEAEAEATVGSLEDL